MLNYNVVASFSLFLRNKQEQETRTYTNFNSQNFAQTDYWVSSLSEDKTVEPLLVYINK